MPPTRQKKIISGKQQLLPLFETPVKTLLGLLLILLSVTVNHSFTLMTLVGLSS